MNIDSLAISLSPREIPVILQSFPMPRGVTFSDCRLTDRGLEIIVKASSFMGLPIVISVEVQKFSGSKIWFKVSPPIQTRTFAVIRPLIENMAGTRYTGYSTIELDIIALSKGSFTHATIDRIDMGKNGVSFRLSDIRAKQSWRELLESATSQF